MIPPTYTHDSFRPTGAGPSFFRLSRHFNMHLFLWTILLLTFGANAYLSVTGLMAVFPSSNMIPFLIGTALELGKLFLIFVLHRRWSSLRFSLRLLFCTVAAALTLITLLEVYGYWTYHYRRSTVNHREIEVVLEGLDEEAFLYKTQMDRIAKTLAGLPASYVTQRLKGYESTGYTQIETKLREISRQKKDLKRQFVSAATTDGSLIDTARALDWDEHNTVAIFNILLSIVPEILLLTLVLISGNLVHNRVDAVQIREKQNAPDRNRPDKPIGPVKGPISSAPSISNTVVANPKSSKPDKSDRVSTNGESRNYKMRKIVFHNNLSVEDILHITGKSKRSTVIRWLGDKKCIPDKSFRMLRHWSERNGHDIRPHIARVDARHLRSRVEV